ncbi:hypothetical protein AAFF39_10995 [Lactococcus garvieae]
MDEILLDSAQMPLIISGAPKVQSNYFENTNAFITILKKKSILSWTKNRKMFG